jgi:hypothetical protein
MTTRDMQRLAWAAVGAQLLFVGGFLVLGMIEGHGFSAARHDISDLGALTAHHVGAWTVVLAVSGAITVAFALGVLRPLLGGVGPWLVALSLPALDNLGDVFFRLDCRAADPGCDTSAAISSWHGKAHIVVFAIALIPTIAAPFVIAARMRGRDGWRVWARPTRTFGWVALATLVLSGVAQGSSVQGAAQRLSAAVVTAGIAVLALWCAQIARQDQLIHTGKDATT